MFPDILGMEIKNWRDSQKVTVLYRKSGTWSPVEVSRLVNALGTVASGLSSFPEYVLLMGDFTKEDTLRALGGGIAYTAKTVIGMDNLELPFKPRF